MSEVFKGMVSVVGNLRFFILVSGLLVVLVMGSKWWSFSLVGTVAAGWLALNLVADVLLRGRKDRVLETPLVFTADDHR